MKSRFMVVALAMVALMCSCSSRTELFNGKDLSGWVCVVDETSGVPASEVYGVTSIPTNFLISPEGKIVARDLQGDDLIHQLQHFIEGKDFCTFPQLHDDHTVTEEAVK